MTKILKFIEKFTIIKLTPFQSCILITCIVSIFTFDRLFENQIKSDIPSFYFAGKAFQSNNNIYDLNTLQSIAGVQYHVYKYIYSPVPATLFSIFSGISINAFQSIIILLNLVSLIFAIRITIKILQSDSIDYSISIKNLSFDFAFHVIVLSVALALPIRKIFYLGQIDGVILMLIVLVFEQSRKNRQLLAGLIFGSILLFKFFPIILLGYFVIKKQYRVVLGTFTSIIGIFIIFTSMFGLQQWQNYYHYLSTGSEMYIRGGLNDFAMMTNISSFAFFKRIGIENPLSLMFSHLTFILGLLTISFFFLKRYIVNDKSVRYILPFLIVSILFQPLSWGTYLNYLLPGLCFFVYLIVYNQYFKRKILLLSTLFILIILYRINIPAFFYRLSDSNYSMPYLTSIILYILIIIFIMFIYFVRKSINPVSGKFIKNHS
ncbi:MAG: hypothetical protein HW421_149 [Ignavibacteria bacterium]|nr:hypothetical protein [Ignavibacteria bacterium]